MRRLILVSLVPVAVGAVACAVPFMTAVSLADTALPQSPPSALARKEIPPALLPHYMRSPACHGLPWQVVAAIGYVESRHASAGGPRLDPATGEVSPPIVGIALDGSRSAAIRVPDHGSPWHDDPVWDHAAGPMQFITDTWSRWKTDASGDGLASPHNAYDAIATAGRYLCGGKQRLDGLDGVKQAVRRYNPSDRYVADVLARAYDYGMVDGGDRVDSVPAADGALGIGPVLLGDAGLVVVYALAQMGDPYVWGAEGPDAFDCSGLTMAAYRQVGVRLPHKSALQVRHGAPVSWRQEAIRPGDLVFLRGGYPVHDYGHVGIAVSRSHWVQAPRTGDVVRMERIPYPRIQAVRRLLVS